MAFLAMLSGFAILPCSAIAVDTELVLMVDAQTYSQSDFDLILDSVARSFENQTFQNAVLNGQTGKMAASVFLFNMPGEQVGIPWMELSSAQDMNFFAQNIRSILYPNSGGNVNYATAISTGASQLNGNNFTGTNRQITLIDDATGFWPADPIGTRFARDAALASGVDVINAIAFDAQYNELAVSEFYNNNFVSPGSQTAVVSTPQGGSKSSSQINTVITAVTGTVSSPTIAATGSITAVPEPSALAMAGLSSLLVLRRRR